MVPICHIAGEYGYYFECSRDRRIISLGPGPAIPETFLVRVDEVIE